MKRLLENESYSLGMSLTIEALKCCPEHVNSIYLSSKAIKNRELDLLLDLAKKNSIEVICDDLTIEKYSLKENCYCIGFFSKYRSELSTNKHIVCYEFSDIGQLGTIFRSAVSFNFKDIVLINTNIDYFDPRVVRASMGSVYHLSIASYNNMEEYLSDYKHEIYCFNSNGVNELQALKPKVPYSLVFSEDQNALNKMFKNAYYLKHKGEELPLSTISTIVFNHCYTKDNL